MEQGSFWSMIGIVLKGKWTRWKRIERGICTVLSRFSWTNTCCSHPAPNELIMAAAYRRLQEEMGIRASLRPMFTTRYYLEVGDGMIENEMDHVLFGISDQEPKLNELEVMDQRYVHQDRLEEELREHPEQFTEWFKVIWSEYVELKGEKIGEGQ